MAKIILGYRQDYDSSARKIITYSNSTHKALTKLGHTVLPIGGGHTYQNFTQLDEKVIKSYDLFLDLDCGRNRDGKFNFSCQEERALIPSAVRWIDSHGYPSYHKRASVNYDHVFFAVWRRRDLFVNHPSAHWCPNASDANYFSSTAIRHAHATNAVVLDGVKLTGESFPFDVGFYGSKGGLARTNALKDIAARHNWNVDIREIGRANRNRWPTTAQAMDFCKVLFNHGQKHDGPNQRVIESMLVGRPLVSDRDKTDGMAKLFEEGEHYLGYDSDAELADNIGWCLREPSLAQSMAGRARVLAESTHQVRNRVKQILEVTGV